MKHAYLIQIHLNFSLLDHLLEMFDSEKNDFYILVDKKVKSSFSSLVTYKPKYSKIYEVPRISIFWGGSSMIQAIFSMLRSAKEHGPYDYYHYMQGADFPIRSVKEIEDFYREHAGKEFIHFNPKVYSEGKYKLNYHHFFVNNQYYRNCKLLHYLSHGIAMIERRLWKGKFPDREFYAGSALWSITDDFCEYLLNHPSFEEQSKHALCSDEALFQTLIMESPFKDNIYRFEEDGGNLYYIDWKRRVGNSPHTFTIDDYETLIHLPEYYLFARKITDAESMPLIERLYSIFKK